MLNKGNYELVNIGNTDEMPVWFDMPSARTVATRGEKTVTISTTGHEKSCFTVVLSCLADGTKLKPMVIFKWKTQRKEKFPPGVVVHHHPKGWMDADGMKLWIQKVWSSQPGGLLRKKKLACLGLVSSPPCRPGETSTPPDQHRCGSDTRRIDQHTTAIRCVPK